MKAQTQRGLAVIVPVAALTVVALAATSAEARTREGLSRPRTIAVIHDFVGALAQSKNRLAWLRGPAECPKAEVLDLRSRRRVKVSSRKGRGCGVIDSYGVLAFDGNRLLWQGIEGYSLAEISVSVFTAALNDRRTRALGGGALERNGALDYQPPFPMAGAAGHLLWYDLCEVEGAGCSSGTSVVHAVKGRGSRKLFTAKRPAGLALAGNNLAVLEDRVGCCQYSPVWSPDGQTIVWHRWGDEGDENGQTDLVAANADGSHLHVVATDSYAEASPSWSADSSRIAFTRSDSTGSRDAIYVVNADGSGEAAIGLGSFPQWSPSGSAIAFVRGDDIYRVNGDGTAETRLTSDAVPGTGRPRWSPDGTKLVVARGGRAYVVDAVSGGATVLAPVPVDRPTWSPDGTRIAFGDGRSIGVMNADGSGAHLLTNNPHYRDDAPAWSSDGSEIAFVHVFVEEDHPGGPILVINADGSGSHRVSGSPHAGAPAWAPGRRVLAWGDDQWEPSLRVGGLFVGSSATTAATRIAGWDEAPVEIRGASSGALRRSFVVPGTAVNVAISTRYVAVVVRNEGRLELRRYRADGTALGSAKLPAATNPYLLAVGAKTIVYDAPPRGIFAVDAETGSSKLLVKVAAPAVGLSIVGRRVVWAENLVKGGARVRALEVPR